MNQYIVARAPFPLGSEKIPDEGIALQDPYIQDDFAIVKPAEDFTVSITTISSMLFSQYRDFYKADRHDNDYFAVLSSVGLGDQDKPTVKVHYLERHEKIDRDIDSLYAENVLVVEDYQSNGKKERLYLAFHGLCQDLGSTKLEQLREAVSSVAKAAGAKFLGLTPFVAVGKVVAEGVSNLLRKLSNHADEVQTVEFNLYPATENRSPHPGDAPLQSGAYVLFFEPIALEGLRLNRAGIVVSRVGQKVNPYLVVNIKKEVIISPEQLNTSAAIEVLESFHAGPGEFAPKADSPARYVEALAELGKTYRLAEQARRYFALKKQGNRRSPEEEEKFLSLAQILTSSFPNWDSEDV